MNRHHIARLGQYCSVWIWRLSKISTWVSGSHENHLKHWFSSSHNPGGGRILFSQLIFIQPFQFGPALNAILGKITFACLLHLDKFVNFSPLAFPTQLVSPQRQGDQKPQKIVFLLRRNTTIFSSCWCKKSRFCYLLQRILPQTQICLGNVTCVPPTLLPSTPALNFGRLFTTASNRWLQSTDLL